MQWIKYWIIFSHISGVIRVPSFFTELLVVLLFVCSSRELQWDMSASLVWLGNLLFHDSNISCASEILSFASLRFFVLPLLPYFLEKQKPLKNAQPLRRNNSYLSESNRARSQTPLSLTDQIQQHLPQFEIGLTIINIFQFHSWF